MDILKILAKLQNTKFVINKICIYKENLDNKSIDKRWWIAEGQNQIKNNKQMISMVEVIANQNIQKVHKDIKKDLNLDQETEEYQIVHLELLLNVTNY
jgi:hypothetical protein